LYQKETKKPRNCGADQKVKPEQCLLKLRGSPSGKNLPSLRLGYTESCKEQRPVKTTKTQCNVTII